MSSTTPAAYYTDNSTVYEQIGSNTPAGVELGGKSTSKIGMYGVTPVVQASAITAATDLTTALVSVTALIAAVKGIGITL
jgi:hypothetical protein